MMKTEQERIFYLMRPYMPHWPELFEIAKLNPVIYSILTMMMRHPDSLHGWLRINKMLGDVSQRPCYVAEPPRFGREVSSFQRSRASFDWKKRQSNDDS